MIYECPSWCIYKDAPLNEFEGTVFGHEHSDYYGSIKGSDDVVLSNAPEHVGVRVLLMDFETHRPYEKLKMYAELRHLHAAGEQVWFYVSIDDGGGLDLAPHAGGQAGAFADQLSSAAANFRGLIEQSQHYFTGGHQPILEV